MCSRHEKNACDWTRKKDLNNPASFQIVFTSILPNARSESTLKPAETNNEARYYVDGTLAGIDTDLQGFDLGNLVDSQNWLGRSQFGADAFFAGNFEEFRIFDAALTDEQVLGNFLAGPNTLNQDVVPEPGSIAIWSLLALAMGGFGCYRIRPKK